MPAVLTKVKMFYTLTHPHDFNHYDFHPNEPTEGLVGIAHATARGREWYTVTTEEARGLWRRLRNKGFERF